MPAFFEIFMAMIGAIMSGASIFAQDSANQQNIALAKETLNKQQAFSEEAAAQAQQRQIDMYKEFFSPQGMMKQYKEAGLNPSLMYAKGGVGGSSQSVNMAATPAATVPYVNPLLGQGQMSEMMNVIKTMTEAQKTKSETEMNYTRIDEIKQNIEKSKKEIEEIESKIGVNTATTQILELQKQLNEIEVKFQNETYNDRVDKFIEEYNVLTKTREKLEKEINGLDIENKYKDDYWKRTNDLLKEQANLCNEQAGLAAANAALAEWQKAFNEKTEDYQVNIAKFQALCTEHNATAAEWNAKTAEQNYYKAKAEVKILEEKMEAYRKYGAKVMESSGWAQTLVNLLVALGYNLDTKTYSGGY